MLKKLELHGFSLAPKLEMDPVAPRYNLIAGDNGLGKSFLLDAAWWVLTGTWANLTAWGEHVLVPSRTDASMKYEFDTEKGKKIDTSATWDAKNGRWIRTQGRPPNPGLVIYARVDGSFSVWDPQRNYKVVTNKKQDVDPYPTLFRFRPEQVEEGLKSEDGTRVWCRGLVAEFESWKLQNGPEYQLLETLLSGVGPDDEKISFGSLDYTLREDDRPFPTVRMPYGEVSLLYLPAGIRRMVRLVYLLAWVLSGHRRECQKAGVPIARQITILFDEPETHLHPRWQRSLLPRLHAVLQRWEKSSQVDIQILAATHSPLVLASLESQFDPKLDALWMLDLVGQQVVMKASRQYRRGTVGEWLTSEVFDLGVDRSREAEAAILLAKRSIREKITDVGELTRITGLLKATLSDVDRYWTRWADYVEAYGVET